MEQILIPDLLKMYLMGATNPVFSNKIEMSDEVIDWYFGINIRLVKVKFVLNECQLACLKSASAF
ncbi:MAG: hypothetical protein U0T74_12935 [Chitinophagales bacterium]